MTLTQPHPPSFESGSAEDDLAVRVHAAIARGIAALERLQLPRGELPVMTWRPEVPEWTYDASIFATALVAWSTRGVSDAAGLRRRACDFLEAQREPLGIWRHWTRGHPQFHYLPQDLDDTSVVCLALGANGRPVPRNRSLLLANRAANGLFYSWISARRSWVPSLAYWWVSLVHLATHPKKSLAFYHITPSVRRDIDGVVNANTLAYLGLDRATAAVPPFLLSILREGRETGCDKWYDSHFVVLYFLSRALRRAGIDAGDLVLTRLAAVAPDSALELALSMCVEMDWNRRPSGEAVRSLLEAQPPEGAWPLAPFYKGGRVRWGSESLTSGFCVEALSRWLIKGR